MTDEFINIVRDEYETWRNDVADYFKKQNSKVEFDNSLRAYLKNCMSDWIYEDLDDDKYPIYCYVGFKKPLLYNMVGRKNVYQDIYWSLQSKGLVVAAPTDNVFNGNRREEFKKTHDIIYAPKGKSFYDYDTFYGIQAEYIEEALRTNQEEAKKLILSKYGRK